VSRSRSRLVAIVLLLAFPAWAADDKPRRILLENGNEEWNRAAVEKVDAELKRCQRIEKNVVQDKEELVRNGMVFALIALGVGATVGIGVGIGIGVSIRR
jgi:hypothetical protein